MAMLLENMQVFVRVVELGSLSAAGRQLRLSPAVVSHRLQQLENHLGVRLLNRTTRQVQPTEQGAAYYEACQEVLAALAHAESVVADAGGTPRGNLRVTAPLGFGRRILAPLIPRFIARYPQLDVRLRLSDHLLDLLREAVDVAIRLAVLADSSLIARKIADCPRLLCAAPDYLAAHGTPERPEDLLEPSMPAAALSRLAAIPLDAAHAGRPGGLRRRRPDGCRRRRRAHRMGAARAGHRPQAGVRGRRASARRPAGAGAAGISARAGRRWPWSIRTASCCRPRSRRSPIS